MFVMGNQDLESAIPLNGRRIAMPLTLLLNEVEFLMAREIKSKLIEQVVL